MYDRIYAIISAIADNYGFDADEAMELVEEQVSVIVESSKPAKAEKPVKEKAAPKKAVEKIEEESEDVKKTRHNIDLWEKKLEAGSVKDRDAHVAKIEKEKAKLTKLLAKAPVKEEKPAKAAAKAPVKEEKPVEAPEKDNRRIKRFSPAQKKLLEEALTESEVDFSDPKDFENKKQQLIDLVNKMTDAEYKLVSQADHFKNFAKSLSVRQGAVETAPSDECGSGCVSCFRCAEHVSVTTEELRGVKMLVETGPEPGTFWDADNLRFVDGPAQDSDEDMSEVSFEGKTYAVGDNTGRVYEVVGDNDVFVGFKGVGKFKKLA
jgi:hypothetical protein